MIKRLSFADLDFYSIRQRSTPVIRNLELDEHHVYVIEEDHRWLVGQQASHTLPRLHKVKSNGIPFGAGPRWEDECGAGGDVNMSFCERSSCDRSPGIAPCWRHEVSGNNPLWRPKSDLRRNSPTLPSLKLLTREQE